MLCVVVVVVVVADVVAVVVVVGGFGRDFHACVCPHTEDPDMHLTETCGWSPASPTSTGAPKNNDGLPIVTKIQHVDGLMRLRSSLLKASMLQLCLQRTGRYLAHLLDHIK